MLSEYEQNDQEFQLFLTDYEKTTAKSLIKEKLQKLTSELAEYIVLLEQKRIETILFNRGKKEEREIIEVEYQYNQVLIEIDELMDYALSI